MRAIQCYGKEREEEGRRTLRFFSQCRNAVFEVYFFRINRKGSKDFSPFFIFLFYIYGNFYKMALYDLDCPILDMVTCGIPVAVWLVTNKMIMQYDFRSFAQCSRASSVALSVLLDITLFSRRFSLDSNGVKLSIYQYQVFCKTLRRKGYPLNLTGKLSA